MSEAIYPLDKVEAINPFDKNASNQSAGSISDCPVCGGYCGFC